MAEQPAWTGDFKDWLIRNKRFDKPVATADWTLGNMAGQSYLGGDPEPLLGEGQKLPSWQAGQDWWKDPLSYQWGADTAAEESSWRNWQTLVDPTVNQIEMLGLIAEWAGLGGGTALLDVQEGTTPDDTATILPGSVNPDDPSEIWVLPISLYGFEGGYYKVGTVLPLNGVPHEVGQDGILRKVEEGYTQPDQLEPVEIPTFEEFLAGLEEHGFTWDMEGTDVYKDWQSLTDILASGVRPEDTIASLDYADMVTARSRGFETVGEYTGWLAVAGNASVYDMSGLGAEEMATRERFNRTIIREQEERMMRAMSVHRAGGGTLGSNFAQMDQFNQQIRDTQLQAAVQINDDNFQARLTEWNRLQDRYDQAVESGEMSADDYMRMLGENRAEALTEYSEQLDVLISQNMQYLHMYAGEFDALVGGFDMAYKIANLAMALTDQDMAIVQQAWDEFMDSAAWQQMIDEMPTEGEEALDSFLQIVGMILGFAGTVIK